MDRKTNFLKRTDSYDNYRTKIISGPSKQELYTFLKTSEKIH